MSDHKLQAGSELDARVCGVSHSYIEKIYRIQDASGRGPFRPGFSRQWVDAHSKTIMPPSWMEEFGDDLIDRLGLPNETFGSGVRSLPDLNIWFTDIERRRLDALGYFVVCLPDVRILAESKHQVVFARMLPLCALAIGLGEGK